MSSISTTIYLDDFDDKDVIKRGLYLANDEELKKELTERGFTIQEGQGDIDIVSQSLLDRFLEGFHKINRKDLEEFFDKQTI